MKASPIPSGQNEGIGNAVKALPMPSGKDEGTANFPYQILLVKFHLQYRNDNCVGSRGDLSIVNKNSWEC